VVAYGLILPKAILDATPLGCFNLHASLLPRWRGAAPINRAIMAGDAETGVMVMKMEQGLDTGPVAMAETVRIAPDATAGELHNALAPLGADLMVRALAALERGTLTLTPQPEQGVTYARKIGNEETRIDWARPAREVHNHIRGLSPFPGAWFELSDHGKPVRVKVLRSAVVEKAGTPGTLIDGDFTVACGAGAIRVLEAQRAGRQAMRADEFLRGTPLAAGTRVS
jgi:methionyl-tRNA formyltransferase